MAGIAWCPMDYGLAIVPGRDHSLVDGVDHRENMYQTVETVSTQG